MRGHQESQIETGVHERERVCLQINRRAVETGREQGIVDDAGPVVGAVQDIGLRWRLAHGGHLHVVGRR